MGVPAEPRLMGRARLLDRRGIALPAALIGIVAIGLLSAAAWVVVDLNARAAINREASGRALQLAEAGAAHALSVIEAHLDDRTLTHLLMGSDSVAGTADDGLLTGYSIPDDEQIPAEGFAWGDGTYTVKLLDDPRETDGNPARDRNGRIVVRCTASLADGSGAAVDIVYGSGPAAPALVVNGPVSLRGSVELRGSCGGVYANDRIDVTGTLVVEQDVISADTVAVNGAIVDPSLTPVTPLSGEESIPMPEYDLWDSCDGADYILGEDGWIVETSTGERTRGTGQGAFGWRQRPSHPVVWELQANSAVEGTFCAQGNVEISGNLGSGLGEPFRLSVFATGGISVSGSVRLQAEHPAGYLLIAQGDLKVSGTPGVGVTETYRGTLYAGSQCEVSGNPRITGQLFCADGVDPDGARDYARANDVSGNTQLTHACPPPESTARRAFAWYQRFGG